MFNALIKAQEELKKQGKDEWNISALSELSGILRPTIRKFKKNGREIVAHGNAGKKRPVTKLTGFEARINGFLRSGCSNSSKVLEESSAPDHMIERLFLLFPTKLPMTIVENNYFLPAENRKNK